MPHPDTLIDAVLDAVRDAGGLIEEVRASAALDIAEKGGDNPVTRADHASDAYLREELRRIHPAAWLSEETADAPDRLRANALWVVDPLDGTKEFIEGVPQYAVAVALVEDGRPVLAVVHCPPTGESFWAVRGAGAYAGDARVRVAEGDGLLASRSEMKRGEFDGFDDWALQPVGSIALKLGMVAAGRAALTLSRGPKWEWDVCAGSLLVEEAGGRAFDMFGAPLRFNQPCPKVRGILAGAPGAVARCQALLATVGASDRMSELL